MKYLGIIVAFGVDNTKSNIGAKNSVKLRVTQVNPSIYFVGCACHIIHNAHKKLLKPLEMFVELT